MGALRRHRRETGWTWRWWRGAVLVMGPDRVPRRLEGAAAATWVALDRPAELDELVPTDQPDARPLAEEALGALVALGAVVEEPPP